MLDLDLKYPLIAYIILELKFKYPLIAYIILGLKKVQNIFKPDNRLGIGSTLFYGRLWIWPIVMIVRTYGSRRKNIDNFVLKYIKTEDRYPCWNGASVVSIVFDSLHIFIIELLDYLLPIKNGYIMGGGGGGISPMG